MAILYTMIAKVKICVNFFIRVMRQILLCVKPITDVLLLILFFIVFFSLLGENS